MCLFEFIRVERDATLMKYFKGGESYKGLENSSLVSLSFSYLFYAMSSATNTDRVTWVRAGLTINIQLTTGLDRISMLGCCFR
jgi:hypothetical protein